MNDPDRLAAIRLRELREAYEAEHARILAEHMSEHYPNANPFWVQCRRASIDVASWPPYQRKATYGQTDLEI